MANRLRIVIVAGLLTITANGTLAGRTGSRSIGRDRTSAPSLVWGSSWSNPGWGSPPSMVGRLSVSAWSAQRLQVWGRGTDGHLKTTVSGDGAATWSTWADFPLAAGITAAGDPVAISRSLGTTEIVVKGSDGNLHYNRFFEKWIGWQAIPGSSKLGAVALNSWTKERLDLWAVSVSGIEIAHAVLIQPPDVTTAPAWSTWAAGGTLASPTGTTIRGIAALSRGFGLIDVAALSENTIHTKHYNEDSRKWSEWRSWGTQPRMGPPALSSSLPNRLDVWTDYLDPQGRPIAHKVAVDGQAIPSAWDTTFLDAGGPGPAAVSRSSGETDLFRLTLNPNSLRVGYMKWRAPALTTGFTVGTDHTLFTPPAGQFATGGPTPNGSNYLWEFTSAATIGPSCQAGRMALSGSVVGATQNEDIVRINLSDWSEAVPAGPPALPPEISGSLENDGQMVRTKAGALVLARGVIKNNPIAGLPGPFIRSATVFWRSVDCGSTWTFLSSLDPLAWPTGSASCANFGQPQPGGMGGWDREEAYVDPASGRLYLSMSGNACTNPFVGKQLLFKSVKSADDTFTGNDTDFTVSESTDLGMVTLTSLGGSPTQDGRLYMHGCPGFVPKVAWRTATGALVSTTALWDEGAGQTNTLSNGCADGIWGVDGSRWITPVGRYTPPGGGAPVDILRTSYPSWTSTTPAGGLVMRVVYVAVPSNATSGSQARVMNGFVIGNPAKSMVQQTWIAPDGQAGADGQTAVAYWRETDGNDCAKPNKTCSWVMKAAIVRDGAETYVSAPQTVSAAFTTDNAGKMPLDGTCADAPCNKTGDFSRGSFVMGNSKMRFYLQWITPYLSGGGQKRSLHGTVIEITP